MGDQTACRYLVSHLKGDALTWWRTYCEERGGLNSVFTNLDLDTLIDALTEQFVDIDRLLRIRVELFSIR